MAGVVMVSNNVQQGTVEGITERYQLETRIFLLYID